MTDVAKSLGFALSKLKLEFPDNPEKLHLAVALVFSSIFQKYGTDVVVVGGQAASHWLKVDGSIDVDFVAPDFHMVRDTLQMIGFVITDKFRMIHHDPNPEACVLIELVGETIQVAGLSFGSSAILDAQLSDIENQTVRNLMLGNACVIDPALVFLNYAEASLPDSIWYEPYNNGLAYARASALLELYEKHIPDRLNRFAQTGQLSKKLLRLLADEFQLNLMGD